MTDSDWNIIEEINSQPIENRLAFLYKLFTEGIYFREDSWFHYQDGLPYEIKNLHMLELLGKLLKEMSENSGKLKTPKETPFEY